MTKPVDNLNSKNDISKLITDYMETWRILQAYDDGKLTKSDKALILCGIAHIMTKCNQKQREMIMRLSDRLLLPDL